MDFALKEKPVENVGKKKILPSSFTNGKRCYSGRYYDAMAVCLAKQRPDLFCTLTGIIESKELHRLTDGRSKSDLIDIANRIFALKLKQFMHDIIKKQIFGKIVGEIWVIEYQKRGIPHAHICLCLDKKDKLRRGTDVNRMNDYIDQLIWAEIPVDADDHENAPAAWRIADVGRMDRWCANKQTRHEENRSDDEDYINELIERTDILHDGGIQVQISQDSERELPEEPEGDMSQDSEGEMSKKVSISVCYLSPFFLSLSTRQPSSRLWILILKMIMICHYC